MSRIEAYPDKAVWIHRLPAEQIEKQLEQAVQRKQDGVLQPLFGLTFAIKDNIDFGGSPTTAACPDFSYVAEKSATVVAKLCEAGAIAIGKTNLDQFATGLVGVRSPYGAVKNPFNSEYISGGSSSGSAVAVATGLVDFALGTDTAGSGRVPAGFCGLVGFKPSRGMLSTTGVVPACRSLDCVSILARTCEEAAAIFSVARGFDEADIYSRSKIDRPETKSFAGAFRFGVPGNRQLEFFGDTESEQLYRHAVEDVKSIGGVSVEIDYTPFAEAAKLLYEGSWTAERFLVCRELLERNPESLLPVTRSIIAKGMTFSAADAFESQYKLLALRWQAQKQWEKMDVLLLPTAGTVYTIAQVKADPIQLNTNLGYYTNFVNLLDLCAIAVPAGVLPNGVPMGVTFIAPAGADDQLLTLGGRFLGKVG